MMSTTRIASVLTLSMAFLSCRSASASMPLRAPAPDSLKDGIALYEKGKYAEAEATLKEAKGTEADAYKAAALVKMKKYEEAEEPAKAAASAEPSNEIAVTALGESLVNLKKYDEAIDMLSTSIKAEPDMAYAYFWRAQAYQGKKKADRMIEDFDTFLKLAPKAPEASAVRQTLSALK
jgi:tetratricopeptide (TPR) repeat protein